MILLCPTVLTAWPDSKGLFHAIILPVCDKISMKWAHLKMSLTLLFLTRPTWMHIWVVVAASYGQEQDINYKQPLRACKPRNGYSMVTCVFTMLCDAKTCVCPAFWHDLVCICAGVVVLSAISIECTTTLQPTHLYDSTEKVTDCTTVFLPQANSIWRNSPTNWKPPWFGDKM